MRDESIIHREFHVLGRLIWATSAVSIMVLAVTLPGGLPMNGWRGWATFAALLALLVAAVAHGTYRMNRIVLKPSSLRVGRETFERSDFDFGFGVQPPLVLSVDEQQRIEEEWPLPPHGPMRIAGGSWGRRRGTSMLVMKLAKTGRLLAIFSRRPAELDRALTAWLEQPS